MKTTVTNWEELCDAVLRAKGEGKRLYIYEIYGKAKKNDISVGKIESIRLTNEE